MIPSDNYDQRSLQERAIAKSHLLGCPEPAFSAARNVQRVAPWLFRQSSSDQARVLEGCIMFLFRNVFALCRPSKTGMPTARHIWMVLTREARCPICMDDFTAWESGQASEIDGLGSVMNAQAVGATSQILVKNRPHMYG
ncbi:unnamed protein product [Durusdinium trenchii]|uniref:Uncharacterized protein n=1 Tax=Durusdinium trenchii TaxID=1381693 RepID=A0ABP0RJY0_9DINO